MAIRDAIPNSLPQSAEEKAGADLWALLTDAEKENRNLIFEEEAKKRQTAVQEALEEDAEIYFAKDPVDRLQHVFDIKQKERNEQLKNVSAMKKLTDQEKHQIFRCIRYSFLPQDILLKLSTDPEFVLCKEMVVQGLAVKLAGVEQFNSDDLKIIVKPRHTHAINNYESAHTSLENVPQEPVVQNAEMATIDTNVNVIGVGQLANMGSMASVNQQLKKGNAQSAKKSSALN